MSTVSTTLELIIIVGKMAIRRTKRIDLSQFSDEWKDSYIEVATMGFKQIREFSAKTGKLQKDESEESSLKLLDMMIKLVKHQFVSGKIFDGELRDLTKDDLEDFDQEVLTFVIQRITGSTEKKG